MYECTYALRGTSGIPRDTRNLVSILDSLNDVQLVVNLSSTEDQDVSSRIKSKLNKSKVTLQTLFQGFLGNDCIEIERVNQELGDALLIENHIAQVGTLWKMKINYLGRFIRVIFRNPMTLNLSGYDFFIQQQIDPISVRGVARHVVRLHDILPVTHPKFFKIRAALFFKIALLRMLKNQAISWVMDTNASADDFKALYGSRVDVAVIPSLIEPEFIDSEISLYKKKTILMVNTIEPRKKVEAAIEAFVSLQKRQSIDFEWQFVVAGNQGWKSRTLMKKLRSGYFGNSVIYKEGLSNPEIVALMSESAVIVSASAAEGFGLPPLEGTAMGCVAAVSDIPQHRETLGKFGFYFNPADQGDIERVLKIACEHSGTLSGEEFAEMRSYIDSRFGKVTVQQMWDSYIRSKRK